MSILACIQMASGPNVQANLEEAGRWIKQAVNAGAKMIVLPENFSLMGMRETDKIDLGEAPSKGPMQTFLSTTAKKYKVWVVGGSIPLKCNNPNRVRTAVLVYDDSGVMVARYDKIHLFDVKLPDHDESYHESATVDPGEDVVVVDTPIGRMGVAVCYDLRFPEMFRSQIEQGMEILAVPSAFTAVTGKAHWDLLVRTRALENQCYVAAANQGGYHVNGRETYGHSMIVDPWGVVLDSMTQGAGFVNAEIDLIKLQSVRTTFPVLQHRRLSCRLTS